MICLLQQFYFLFSSYHRVCFRLQIYEKSTTVPNVRLNLRIWHRRKSILLRSFTSECQIIYLLATFGTVVASTSHIGLVRALYMPDKPNLIYDWAKEKYLNPLHRGLIYARRTSRATSQASSLLEHLFFCSVDDCVYLIGDFIR